METKSVFLAKQQNYDCRSFFNRSLYLAIYPTTTDLEPHGAKRWCLRMNKCSKSKVYKCKSCPVCRPHGPLCACNCLTNSAAPSFLTLEPTCEKRFFSTCSNSQQIGKAFSHCLQPSPATSLISLPRPHSMQVSPCTRADKSPPPAFCDCNAEETFSPLVPGFSEQSRGYNVPLNGKE